MTKTNKLHHMLIMIESTMLVPHPANALLLVLPVLSLTLLLFCLQNPITQKGMPIYALIHERYR